MHSHHEQLLSLALNENGALLPGFHILKEIRGDYDHYQIVTVSTWAEARDLWNADRAQWRMAFAVIHDLQLILAHNYHPFMSIDEIEKFTNEGADHHFFDPDTMRFFNSRVLSGSYSLPDDPLRWNFFVTSERYPRCDRFYTVRRLTAAGGVDTIGTAQAYSTPAQARRAIEKLLAAE